MVGLARGNVDREDARAREHGVGLRRTHPRPPEGWVAGLGSTYRGPKPPALDPRPNWRTPRGR
eukprot:11447139-Alexandrium_andersonii.AAC.1